ncbi:MAG TPA: hypothetical protein VFQ94_02860 [Gallionella sp.]|nr:hypothetical protein [Gallionella sp.]
MPNQSEKYHLAMAGKYFVAAQLQRLQASVARMECNEIRDDAPGFREACPEHVEGLHPGYKF